MRLVVLNRTSVFLLEGQANLRLLLNATIVMWPEDRACHSEPQLSGINEEQNGGA